MRTFKLRAALRRGCLLGLVLTLALTLLAEQAGRYRRAAAAVRADTLRLHIVANSDTLADQCAKLRARDAVLAAAAPLLRGAGSLEQAEERLRRALPALCRAARLAAGQPARIRLGADSFPPGDYGDFALPGGEYTALRIELGAGAGHNWFCVLYPALCVQGAVAEYPDEDENELVFGQWRVRFALWDLLCGARQKRESR